MFLRFTSFKPYCSWKVLKFLAFQTLCFHKLCPYKKSTCTISLTVIVIKSDFRVFKTKNRTEKQADKILYIYLHAHTHCTLTNNLIKITGMDFTEFYVEIELDSLSLYSLDSLYCKFFLEHTKASSEGENLLETVTSKQFDICNIFIKRAR